MLLGWLQQDDIDMGSQDDLQKLDTEPPGKCAGTCSVFGVLWCCGSGVSVPFAGPAAWCRTWPDLSIVRRLEPLKPHGCIAHGRQRRCRVACSRLGSALASAGRVAPWCLQVRRSARAAMPPCPPAARHRRAEERCPLWLGSPVPARSWRPQVSLGSSLPGRTKVGGQAPEAAQQCSGI